MARRPTPLAPLSLCALAFAVALGLCGCRKPSADGASPSASASASPARRELTPEQAQEVLAKVGDHTITLGEYVAALERMDSFERLRYQSLDRRKLLLNEMIELELLAQEARRRGLDKQPETEERLRQMLRDELFKDLRQKVPGPNEIPEADVRKYFDEHRSEFNEPERRRVAHIALASEQQAKQILERAMKVLSAPASSGAGGAAGRAPSANAEWGKLVATYSIDKPARALGTLPPELAGDLGIVGSPGHPRGANPRVPEALRTAVFRITEVGQVLPEIVSDGGRYHVVRMTGKTDARERRYEEAERTIRVALVQESIKKREAELEQELRAKYPVTIDPAGLAAVEAPKPSAPAKSAAPAGAKELP
jgi:parvulin-like peptidyl-prolyl isomerase